MYETKYSNEKEISSFEATMIAEGVDETENYADYIKSWSYLIGTKIAFSLQGWFGRQAYHFIEAGFIQPDGTVDWDFINDRLNEEIDEG